MNLTLVFSLGRKGGSVRYAKQVIDNLNIDNIKVFCSSMCEEEVPMKATIIKTYYNKFSFFYSTVFSLIPLLFKLLISSRKHSSIHLYFPYFHFWNYFIIKSFRTFFHNVRVTSTVHDGILHTGDGLPFEQKLNFKCISFSDNLIFLTNFVKENVYNKTHFSSASYVVPHGIFSVNGICNSARVNIKNRLLFFGRVNKYKGVDLLIDSLNYLDNNDYEILTIAGKHSINISSDNPKVNFIDEWVSEEKMINLFNNHDILIIPYREATQSGVISLGIFSCMPMVITSVGGLNEQLSFDESIFVEPNSKDIALGMKKLMFSKNKYAEISQKLYEKSYNLSWAQISNNIQKIIES